MCFYVSLCFFHVIQNKTIGGFICELLIELCGQLLKLTEPDKPIDRMWIKMLIWDRLFCYTRHFAGYFQKGTIKSIYGHVPRNANKSNSLERILMKVKKVVGSTPQRNDSFKVLNRYFLLNEIHSLESTRSSGECVHRPNWISRWWRNDWHETNDLVIRHTCVFQSV